MTKPAGKLAKIYARAIFQDLPREEYDLALKFFEVAKLWTASVEGRRFLANPTLNSKTKAQALLDVARESGVDWGLAEAALSVVADKARWGVLHEVASALGELVDEAMGRRQVRVVWAKEPDKQELDHLRSSLSAYLGAKSVELASSVDPRLQGGFRVQAGYTVIDGSLQRRIQALSSI